MIADETADQLEIRLRQQFSVITEKLTCAGRTFEILHPPSADALIDEEEFKIDERLPYWAEIWPSAQVLAEVLAVERANGRTLLELGSGCGYVATVAGHLAFDVLATDYYEPACEFIRLNAQRHCLNNVRARLVDWKALPDLGKFDLVIAADVLYDRDYCQLIASVLPQTLAQEGEVIITDPGRWRAESFLKECEQYGLTGELADRVPFDDGVRKPTVDIYRLRWKQSRS
jgi:predicted nicotinamide N-methyase